MADKPRILRTETLANTRLFQIEQVDLQFTNGTAVQFERLVGSPYGAVLIVPLLDADTVLLIREYAAGVERYELALPKGRIENSEPMLDAAQREMMEEVGFGARRLEHLRSLSMAPGYSGHVTHVILARELYEHRIPGDEPEPIEVVRWPMARIDELLEREDFTEARSIAALFLVREHLRRG